MLRGRELGIKDFKKVPKCDECPEPELGPREALVFTVYNIANDYRDNNGGIDLSGIQAYMDLVRLGPDSLQAEILRHIGRLERWRKSKYAEDTKRNMEDQRNKRKKLNAHHHSRRH